MPTPACTSPCCTGSSGTFCAGADLKQIGSGNGNRVERDMSLDGPMGPTRMLLDKPVIAAVEGYAVAGGLELALWCDLRVAASDAVFGVYCRRWGVPLIDGGTIRLPRLIGHSHALDMILTGRGVSGDEALRMGLVNRVVAHGEALDAAVALAAEIAALPQRCLRSDRRSSFDQWGLTSTKRWPTRPNWGWQRSSRARRRRARPDSRPARDATARDRRIRISQTHPRSRAATELSPGRRRRPGSRRL